jgi:hypothetical protein
MNVKRYYGLFLMVIIPVLSLQAAAGSQAKQAQGFSQQEHQEFRELYRRLIAAQAGLIVDNKSQGQAIVDFSNLVRKVPIRVLVEMTTGQTNKTLLEFAIQNLKISGYISSLAVNIMFRAQFSDVAEQKRLYEYLCKHLTVKDLVIFLLDHLCSDPSFRDQALKIFQSQWQSSSIDSDYQRVWGVGCLLYTLLDSTLKGQSSLISETLQRLNSLLSRLNNPELSFKSLLKAPLYLQGDATLPGVWFSKDENVHLALSDMGFQNNIKNMNVFQLISIFNCFAKAGVNLGEQSSDTSNNLMFLILEDFGTEFDQCRTLLSYLFEQHCDINQIVRFRHVRSLYSLLYFATLFKCPVDMIVFLLEKKANINEQLLAQVECKRNGVIGVGYSLTTPFLHMIAHYSASDLSKIFDKIEPALNLSELFGLKFEEEIDGVKEYKEGFQSCISIILPLPDYPEKIKLFLKYGADINQATVGTNIKKMTPLMLAVDRAQPAQVEFLLGHGARVIAPSPDNNALSLVRDKLKGEISDPERKAFTQIERMLQNAFDVREQQLQADAVAGFDNIVLQEEEELQKFLETMELDFANAVRKEQNAQKQAQLQQRHLATRQRYFQEQQAKLELIQQKQQLRSVEPAVAKELVAVPRVAKALPAHPIAEQTPNQLLQKYPWEVLNDKDQQRVAEYLKHLTQGLTVSIPKELRLKYGLLSNFVNKTNVVVDLDHILSMQLLIKNNEISFAGGHSYQVFENLIQFPLVHKAIQHVDPVTGCVVFDLRLATCNSQRIFKTTFPENWGTQEILQAIATSEFVKNGPEEEGMEVVYAQTTGKSKIPLKLVFKKASGTFPAKLITVIPAYDLLARELSSPA